MCSKPIFCSKVAQKGKIFSSLLERQKVTQNWIAEHNWERPFFIVHLFVHFFCFVLFCFFFRRTLSHFYRPNGLLLGLRGWNNLANIFKTARHIRQKKPQFYFLAPCNGIRTSESRSYTFLLVESEIREILLAESGIIGFGIRNTAKKIRNPTNN